MMDERGGGIDVRGRRIRDAKLRRNNNDKNKNADVMDSDGGCTTDDDDENVVAGGGGAGGDDADGRYSHGPTTAGRGTSTRREMGGGEMMPLNDVDLEDLLGGSDEIVVAGNGDCDDDVHVEDEDDDEDDGVMNPYVVMNPPFLRVMEYSSSEGGASSSSSPSRQMRQRARALPRSGGGVDDVNRNHPLLLSDFDPYGPNKSPHPHRDDQYLRGEGEVSHDCGLPSPSSSSRRRRQHQQRPHGGMEMEEEEDDDEDEIIDFVRGDDGFVLGIDRIRRHVREEERFEELPPPPHIGGSTRHHRHFRGVEDGYDDGYDDRFGAVEGGGWRDMESTSFSPFPKRRRDRQMMGGRRGDDTDAGVYYGPGGAIPGMLSALSSASGPIISLASDIFSMALSSIAYAGTLVVHAATSNSFAYGVEDDRRANYGDPFRSVGVGGGMVGGGGGGVRRGGGKKSRISSANLRLIIIAITAFFCLRNMTTMVLRTTPDSSGGMSSSTGDGGSGGGSSAPSNSDVTTRIKKARMEHWWNKMIRRRKGGVVDDAVVASEVYVDGKRAEDAAVVGSRPESSDEIVVGRGEEERVENDDPSASASSSGVVVETREDGTILIKLPPPRMHLEGEGVPRARSGIIDPERPYAASSNVVDDETMYIKLPYRPHGRDVHNQEEWTPKREIEPPLRGAAPQESVKLRRFTPPIIPLVDESKRRLNAPGGRSYDSKIRGRRHEDDGGGLLHELRREFESWASAHGKRYSHHEKEHRFSVWRKNHRRYVFHLWDVHPFYSSP